MKNRGFLKYFAVGLCSIGALVWVLILFSSSHSYESPVRATADPGERTPYISEIATQLSKNPVYVDPVLRPDLGESLVTDEVRNAVGTSKNAVFLIVTPQFRGDGINGDQEVFLSRVSNSVGRDGVYLLVDQELRARYVLEDDHNRRLYLPGAFEQQSAESLRQLIEEVDEELTGAGGGNGPFDNAVFLGLVMGGVFSVPIWFLLQLIRWSARRDRSYLAGFRQ